MVEDEGASRSAGWSEALIRASARSKAQVSVKDRPGFLEDAVFRRKSAHGIELVSAAHLPGSGGDELEGIAGKYTRVVVVRRHAPQEREFVRVSTASGGMLVVTANHRVYVEGQGGQPIDKTVKDAFHLWVDQPAHAPRIYDGVIFQTVTAISIFTAIRAVVEVCFNRVGDANSAVLTWCFEGARPRNVRSSAAFACLGGFLCADVVPGFYCVSKTFVDPGEHVKPLEGRSRSCGADADSRSLWSVGTSGHSTDQSNCKVCQFHRRHLDDPHKPPCWRGAACKDCHGHHDRRNVKPAQRTRGRKKDARSILANASTNQEVDAESTLDEAFGSTVVEIESMLVAERVSLLVVVDIDCVLVHRCLLLELKDAECNGYDGSSQRAAFYLRPGLREFLQSLVSLRREGVYVALVTQWSHWTARPIIEAIFNEAALHPDELPCFDKTQTVRLIRKQSDTCPKKQHIDELNASEQGLARQFDLVQIRTTWCSETGMSVDEGRMIIVVSDHSTVRSDLHQFTLRLPTFGLDEIVNSCRHYELVAELEEVVRVVESALHVGSISEYLAVAQSLPRKARPYDEQYENPPPSKPSSPIGLDWLKNGDWYCAEGVYIHGRSEVTSAGPGGSSIWAGARHDVPIQPGQWAEARVEVLSDITSRVGWASQDSREVGTDERSWGYGGFGMKSHRGTFHPYGKVFRSGDRVTSFLDRRGSMISMSFQLDNEARVGKSMPAFSIPNKEVPYPLFFAVCGRPGFEVRLLSFSCTGCERNPS
mmetsp:Transcript_92959/g.199362  ORF Transcript_92959/g.199362 Transcript_92959/m.199362 type:complete len:764 (-) Transcript_92959:225-2516(-)